MQSILGSLLSSAPGLDDAACSENSSDEDLLLEPIRIRDALLSCFACIASCFADVLVRARFVDPGAAKARSCMPL